MQMQHDETNNRDKHKYKKNKMNKLMVPSD